MTVSHFLSLGYIKWLECHWTIARTSDIAERWFKRKGYIGEFHRMCYPTHSKNSDGFFAWWMPIK